MIRQVTGISGAIGWQTKTLAMKLYRIATKVISFIALHAKSDVFYRPNAHRYLHHCGG